MSEGLLTEGAGFDGSSIRGFQDINESDMLLVPDPSTALIDPFHEFPTLSLVCRYRSEPRWWKSWRTSTPVDRQ